MITSVHIENFKCFKDFDIELGPFDVLIGPNDTGKTAFLQAVRVALWVNENRCTPCTPPRSLGVVSAAEATWRNDLARQIRIDVRGDSEGLGIGGAVLRVVSLKGHDFIANVVAPEDLEADSSGYWPPKETGPDPWPGRHTQAAYYRLGPRSLRMRTKLRDSLEQTGEGLPSFLDDIHRLDPEATDKIRKRFAARFPHYKEGTPLIRPVGKADDRDLALFFPLTHGGELSAESVSDGVMMSLAFMAIAGHPDSPEILLIEEPENSVHHASLKDIVQTLRDLTAKEGVQVILTTHSPYLLDYAQPNEVHVFMKDQEGAVHATKLADFEGAHEIGDMFGTGEKWTMLSEKHGI